MPIRFVLVLALCASFPLGAAHRRGSSFTVSATAHSQEGEAADGSTSRVGTVAADKSVLPLGSRIRISGAGKYSGVYKVIDTGRAIRGREIDIYMKTAAEARRFGRRRVTVQILQSGEGTKQTAGK